MLYLLLEVDSSLRLATQLKVDGCLYLNLCLSKLSTEVVLACVEQLFKQC